MKYALPVVAILLCSCASVKPQQFNSPNNKEAYTMKCSGFGRTWMDCYQEATNLCPNGYNTLSKSNEPILINGDLISKREFEIECKD